MIYHVLNRANARRPFFDSAAEFAAFEEVLSEAQQEHPVPVLAFCIMPNHWHLVLAPLKDGDLSRFHRLAHPDPYAALARSARQPRERALVPGPV